MQQVSGTIPAARAAVEVEERMTFVLLVEGP
jgi:hypothetical protein